MADVVKTLEESLATRRIHSPEDKRVRTFVAARAGGRCEYCLLMTGGQFQIDHIIPPALWSDYVQGEIAAVAPRANRRGPDHLDNFAWACPFCNNKKRRTLHHPVNSLRTRIFDPRYDTWAEHFFFIYQYLHIIGLTPIGQATVAAMDLNDKRESGLLGQRHIDILNNEYPPDWARVLNVSI